MRDSGTPWQLGRRPALDGLRGVAVLLVVVSHAGFGQGGGVGVDIFFALSGFLITALLIEEVASRGRVRLGAFYARRAVRLAPALLVLLAAVTVYGRATGDQVSVNAVPRVLLYVGNWNRANGISLGLLDHTWSLAIEEQFYVLWPLVLIVCGAWFGRNRMPAMVLGLAVVGTVAALVVRLSLWDGLGSVARVYNGTDARADSLLVGCALAALMYVRATAAAPLARAWPLAALALVVGVLANPHSAAGVHLYQTVGYSGLAVACAAVVARAVTAVPPPVLTFRPLRWVGRISYGMYLWHYPIMATMHQHGLSDWLALVVGGGLSVAAAAVSWQLVEQPAQRWYRRRASGRDREVVEPSSVVVPGDVKAVLRRG